MLGGRSDVSEGGVSKNSDETYRLSEGVLSVPVEEESILLAMGSEKYFGVRGAIRHLLEGLRDGLSMDSMIADTCARYGVGPEVARKDLETVLPKLIAAGIVERCD
jgi:hypothetical protein